MGKFDRYMLSQLMVLFGFFSLVLVMVYWINRAVILFDQLIANGQSALVFLEFTALTLPNVIRLVLPMAAFAAVVYCTNRLTSESELVVVQSTGYSPYRLARPVVVFGLIVGLLVSALTHVLVPASKTRLSERTVEIEGNMTARLLREGVFIHPVTNMTFYVRDVTPEGELRDVFLSDRRVPEQSVDYTARRALLVRDGPGLKLVMFDGMAQRLRGTGKQLSTTSFSDFVFDIGGLLGRTGALRRDPDELSTWELLRPTEAIEKMTRTKPAALIQAGHERISQALLCVVTSMVGFAALLMGGFSRFGLWRQILIAIFILAVLKSLDNSLNGLARKDETLWPLIYLSTLLGLCIAYAMLWISVRPGLFSRRFRGQPA